MSSTIQQTLAEIPRESVPGVAEAVHDRWNSLTKPCGSLGRLEQSIVQLAQIQGVALPRLERRCMYVFCGDHGIAEEGVSAYPPSVTREMMRNFVRGGAAINVLCRQLAIEACIVDAGVAGSKIEGVADRRIGAGTANFLHGPAMSREQAETALVQGMELARDASLRFDIAGVGEMGIGNTTAASALLCVLAGVRPEEAVGSGTGLDDAGMRHKCNVVTAAIALHAADARDPLAVVGAFAGFEIAMMAGFLLGAASRRLPVMVDGFIGGAAFLIARAFYPEIGKHLFFAHRSAERGHARLLEEAGVRPLLDLDMRLGEGTGAALAVGILLSGLHLYREMATFAEAAVSERST